MDTINFTVNGVSYTVGGDVSSKTTLNEFLRRRCGHTGTKYMCEEGGCGACAVSVVRSPGDTPQTVNSCLVAVPSCLGWEVTTIEKIGNRNDGYHPLQKTLADNNGSQCGYCSPGMIMNMYSFLKAKPRTALEIERALGSNICRCTGYRPILQAFKKFAVDAPTPSTLAIEDLKLTCCSDQPDSCCKQKSDQDWCMVSRNEVQSDKVLHIKLSDNKDWFRANSLNDVLELWKQYGLESYMLVAGNTVRGVDPVSQFQDRLIDISGCSELKGYYLDQNCVVGAGCTLGDLIDIMDIVRENDGFGYLTEITYHLDLVAHYTVRGLGTIGGNLMIKKQIPGFQSDIYLFLETIGGEITIMSADGLKRVISMQGFLSEDMSGKIILNIIIPPLSEQANVRTYKIMPRSQSVHALVNAGFYYELNSSNIVEKCRIVYGALSTNFTRAHKTEKYLCGKNLFLNETLQGAIEVLKNEMVIAHSLDEPCVKYRRQLALGLFYKSILSLCPEDILSDWYRSGALKHRQQRPVSQGHQVFDTDSKLWPITKPLPKTDGLIQCSGEAQYTDDVPLQPGELFIAFVLAKVPLGTIESIDTTRAMSEPGVVAFFSAKDIPGENTFIPAPNSYNLANEELFCDGKVKYFDQPIGVIVAESQHIATYAAANLVDVTYTNVKKPVIDINVAKKDSKRTAVFQTADATKKGNDVTKVIKGNDTVYGQYHWTMETLACVAHPTEEGLKLYATTQWMDLVHQAAARCLNVEQNRIDVITRRIGGGYGIKLGRANMVSVATALVAHKLNRPCRMVNPMTVNMRAMGKRMPCSRDYEVGVNDKGVIQYANVDLYGDNGYIVNEPLLALGMDVYFNCYDKSTWNYKCYNVLTDTPSNTWCRSPGTLENIAMAELMIERIAHELNLDPLEVRQANLADSVRDEILEMTENMKNNARYEERKKAVDTFNKTNRWTKRGLRFCYLRWAPMGSICLEVNVSVFADDGTVIITHGGIEMGQGVNAKAIQIASYILKVSVDKIKVKCNDTIIAPNGGASGGSITSQNVGIGVRRACEELLRRLEPIKKEMDNPTWVELIQKAYASQVDLQAHAYTTSDDIISYDICGVGLCECEIDVLTGEYQIRQVDLIEDVGQSVNPEIDVGQIEGAFVMGMGYWTSENLVYDPATGECITNRSWKYWPPQALDVPQDFRIHFKKKGYSTDLVYGAKGTGEPAACMSLVVALSLRECINAARKDSGIANEWFKIDGPFTLEKVCVATGTSTEEFKLY